MNISQNLYNDIVTKTKDKRIRYPEHPLEQLAQDSIREKGLSLSDKDEGDLLFQVVYSVVQQ